MINIEEHLGLARKCASRWYKSFVGKHEYDDFYQIGCLALIRAARDFDESKGYTFSTFAVTYITNEIYNFVTREKFFQRDKEEKQYSQVQMLSLDKDYLPSNDTGDKNMNFHEILSSGDDTEDVIEKIALRESLKKLNPIEHEIITLRYFKDFPQKDIAKKLNFSQAYISKLEKKTISKISKMVQAV